jgi:hypothetical protein
MARADAGSGLGAGCGCGSGEERNRCPVGDFGRALLGVGGVCLSRREVTAETNAEGTLSGGGDRIPVEALLEVVNPDIEADKSSSSIGIVLRSHSPLFRPASTRWTLRRSRFRRFMSCRTSSLSVKRSSLQ